MRIGIVVLAIAISIGIVTPAAAQCAMCKAAIESSTDPAGAQFNRAILVMMAGPYVIMGVFGVVLFRDRLSRAARRVLGRRGRASALPGPR